MAVALAPCSNNEKPEPKAALLTISDAAVVNSHSLQKERKIDLLSHSNCEGIGVVPRTRRIIHDVCMDRISIAVLLLVTTNAFAGIAYRFDGSTGAGRVIAEGRNLRVEFTRGDHVLFQDSSIVLSTDGGKWLTVLDPVKKTYVTLNVGELLAGLTVGNAKVSARDLGSGGTLEGYPTHRWALDAAYDVAVADARMHVVLHSESWRTDRIPEEVLFSGRADPMAKLMPPQVKGFPLREVTTIRTTPPNGREMTAKSLMEVHDVRRVVTTPAQFEVPAGYKRGR